MGAHRLVRTLKKQGNTVIGAGCYAAVLEQNNKVNTVIKVGTTTSDPWVEYYHKIIKHNQANPFVPKVTSFYMDKEADYYICIMEKLEPLDYNNKLDISDSCTRYLQGALSEKALVKKLAISHPDISVDHLLFILYKLAEFTDVFGDCNPKDYPDDAINLDLHEANIMFRGNHPVITDPWCNVDMEEIGDFEDWICDNGLMK